MGQTAVSASQYPATMTASTLVDMYATFSLLQWADSPEMQGCRLCASLVQKRSKVGTSAPTSKQARDPTRSCESEKGRSNHHHHQRRKQRSNQHKRRKLQPLSHPLILFGKRCQPPSGLSAGGLATWCPAICAHRRSAFTLVGTDVPVAPISVLPL